MKSVTLIQSYRFPNVWSLREDGADGALRVFRDPMFASGALAAEGAVMYARERGWRIAAVLSETEGIDCDHDVVAGIEARTGRKVIEA